MPFTVLMSPLLNVMLSTDWNAFMIMANTFGKLSLCQLELAMGCAFVMVGAQYCAPTNTMIF
jgi:hypothetical protein